MPRQQHGFIADPTDQHRAVGEIGFGNAIR